MFVVAMSFSVTANVSPGRVITQVGLGFDVKCSRIRAQSRWSFHCNEAAPVSEKWKKKRGGLFSNKMILKRPRELSTIGHIFTIASTEAVQHFFFHRFSDDDCRKYKKAGGFQRIEMNAFIGPLLGLTCRK